MMVALVRNEVIKMLKKKRILVIVLILGVLIPIFTYARMVVAQNALEKIGSDWRLEIQQQITDYQNTLSSNRTPEEFKKWRRVAVQQLQYYLDHDVNPNSPNGVTFAREFMSNSVTLFFPLLVMAVASDIVSSERSGGTIKMLLTRPVRRWKILTSKLIATTLFISLIVTIAAVMSYVISGAVFGYKGWTEPVFTGFQTVGASVDTANVHAVPQWLYMIMQSGLIWFSALSVGCLALMVSVLVRSTAASIVTMMAVIIAGTILTNMASAWTSAKYLFMVNLNLANYLQGSPPPIEGMNLMFSVTVLSVWSVAALVIAYRVFTKQDILN
ncbi:ABC transporter permease [Paenibacillus swuensis]|uniref:ABC transporter permease n=1 Tax=Paenibacillus swuensis TaxID=1178515 RepID=A0A172TPR8_9BACL|nr:ABC transporter permease [Paenibacillus swuensis]ANE49010.1 ABC transporter permease [Paenibacillus swuensis]